MKKFLLVIMCILCVLLGGCSNFSTYENRDMGIKFSYPFGMEIIKNERSSNRCCFYAQHASEPGRFLIFGGTRILGKNGVTQFKDVQPDDLIKIQQADAIEFDQIIRASMHCNSVSSEIVRLKNGCYARIFNYYGEKMDSKYVWSKEKTMEKMFGKLVTFYANNNGYCILYVGREDYDLGGYKDMLDSIELF